MGPRFSVHKVVLLDPLQVFVLLQVLAHLHVFWVGLEVGVGRRRRLVRLLQLWGGQRGGGEERRGGLGSAQITRLIILCPDQDAAAVGQHKGFSTSDRYDLWNSGIPDVLESLLSRKCENFDHSWPLVRNVSETGPV